MIDTIKNLLSDFDLANFLPKVDTVMGWITLLLRLAVMAGPIIILVLGIIYLVCPPKEANHSFGFRCYYGMGSVAAWRFTQRLAGMVLGALGLVLTIIMFIICGSYNSLPPDVMTLSAVKCLLWEFGLIAVSCLGIHVTVAVFYDRFGNLRRPRADKEPKKDA